MLTREQAITELHLRGLALYEFKASSRCNWYRLLRGEPVNGQPVVAIGKDVDGWGKWIGSKVGNAAQYTAAEWPEDMPLPPQEMVERLC